jgi:hypothetical protein
VNDRASIEKVQKLIGDRRVEMGLPREHQATLHMREAESRACGACENCGASAEWLQSGRMFRKFRYHRTPSSGPEEYVFLCLKCCDAIDLFMDYRKRPGRYEPKQAT